MSNIASLITLCESYAVAKGIGLPRLSTIVFNDGKVIGRLKDGADITVGRLENAVRWLDANWPVDTPWPEGLPRPSLLAATSPEEAA